MRPVLRQGELAERRQLLGRHPALPQLHLAIRRQTPGALTINGFPRGATVEPGILGQRIESVQLGAKGIDPGAVGTFYLDDFISLTMAPDP